MSTTSRHIGFDVDPNQVAIVSIDVDGKGANIFDADVIEELSAAVRKAHSLRELTGLVFVSAKPKQFIAGASIDEILSVKDPTVGAEKARIGQDLMESIEKLPIPTVALIDGPCVGGGLEFALACTYRIVSDQPEVRLSLPEVRLGIIPGFGGTQRLPEAVGLTKALEIITSGKTLKAKQALSMGLVDDIGPRELLLDIARKWIGKGLRPRKPYKRSRFQGFLEDFGPTRKLIFKMAKKKVMQVTKGHYPAPVRALEVVEKTYKTQDPFRYDLEAQKLGSLVASNISKSLIQIFLATENIRKTKYSIPPQGVNKVAILGAGVMGAGIAHLLAGKKKWVRLQDIGNQPLLGALKSIQKQFEKDRKRRRERRRWADQRMAHISTTKNGSGFSSAQAVIEAVSERIEIKKQVLADAAKKLPSDAVIATNTSALSITEIAADLPQPERVIGMHFFNPVSKMPLIEIVQGKETSSQTVATTMNLAISLGKTPIVVADRPGFLVNRILGIYLAEVIRMAEEGISVEDLESLAKEFGFPMGPFELMDEVGIDVAQHVGKYLSESFCPLSSPLHHASISPWRESTRKKIGSRFLCAQTKEKNLRPYADFKNRTTRFEKRRRRQIKYYGSNGFGHDQRIIPLSRGTSGSVRTRYQYRNGSWSWLSSISRRPYDLRQKQRTLQYCQSTSRTCGRTRPSFRAYATPDRQSLYKLATVQNFFSEIAVAGCFFTGFDSDRCFSGLQA